MTHAPRVIEPALVQSYCEADYVIYEVGGQIALKVDEINTNLATLMKRHGVTSAAFLTAFNPYSVLSSSEENIRNHNALIADIHSLGLKTLAAEGGDPSHVWSSEFSMLVLGISLEDAEHLADRYKQNAFLWVPQDDGFVSLNLRHPVGGSIVES